MRQSVPLAVTRSDIQNADATFPGRPLSFVATIYHGGKIAFPQSVILVAGPAMLASRAADRLATELAVPADRLQIIPLSFPQQQDQVWLIIDFFPDPAVDPSKPAVMTLDVDLMKFSVDMQVSPDGAFVEEVQAQWEPFKLYIKQRAILGLGQKISVGTKIISVFAFDRPASDRVELSVKEKIKLALKADVGPGRRVQVELFGAAGIKLQDNSVKPLFEAGVLLTVPFDLF